MLRTLVRWLAPLLVVAALLTPARAQVFPSGSSSDDYPTAEKPERTPALQYLIAGLMTIGVLLFVCKPSRKG
jgi:hypothetical protein